MRSYEYGLPIYLQANHLSGRVVFVISHMHVRVHYIKNCRIIYLAHMFLFYMYSGLSSFNLSFCFCFFYVFNVCIDLQNYLAHSP